MNNKKQKDAYKKRCNYSDEKKYTGSISYHVLYTTANAVCVFPASPRGVELIAVKHR